GPAALQAHLERAVRDPELRRRLVLRPALQVAQRQRGAMALRERAQLLVQHPLDLAPTLSVRGRALRGRGVVFVAAAPGEAGPRLRGGAGGDAAEPAGPRRRPDDPPRPDSPSR